MLNESTDAVGPLFSGRLYLPDELDQRLEAEGVSKADLIRRGVTKLLDESRKPRRVKPFPVFRSGRRRSADEMQEELVEQIINLPIPSYLAHIYCKPPFNYTTQVMSLIMARKRVNNRKVFLIN